MLPLAQRDTAVKAQLREISGSPILTFSLETIHLIRVLYFTFLVYMIIQGDSYRSQLRTYEVTTSAFP